MSALARSRSVLAFAHRPLPARARRVGVAVLAGAIGLLLGRLPLLTAGILLLSIVLLVLTLIDPRVGLGVALILGPSKPLTDYFLPALPLDLGQIALIVTLGAWALHALAKRRVAVPSSPLNLPLLLFLFAAALSLLNALSLGYALKELLKWVQLLLVMWLVIDLSGQRRTGWVVAVILAAGLAQALIGIWQFGLRGDGPEHFQILGGQYYRAYGTFEQPNPYGGFIGLVLSLSVGLLLGALGAWIAQARRCWRATRPPRLHVIARMLLRRETIVFLMAGLVAGVLGMALVMSWSRGAWLGFGAGALAMLFAWPRRAWLGVLLVGGGLLIGAFALQYGLLPAPVASRLTGFTEVFQSFDARGADINDANFSVLERLAHWQAAEEMARFQPWIGVGFGNYEPVYPAYALANWPAPLGHAHNIYLNTLAETGIIGLAAYLLFWLIVLGWTWRTAHSADIWTRSLAIGLMGAWLHLSVHNALDKLYVANLHLHIGAMLGLLSLLVANSKWENETA
ncbi:MAG: O-antigen ligase family protein [Anaerolineae bacterium]|nr:O-antigen ligase family protein [Anaerolineae bacterium]